MKTRQKMIYSFLNFSRERNIYVSQMFTSDNYIFHKEKHLFSDRRFLQCADFAKTLCLKIRFGVWFYLNQSSEADIQPNLYNQTLSIIFQASQLF